MPDEAPPTAKVFVISLDDASDRRDLFTQRTRSVGVPWQFFDAHRKLSADLVYTEADAVSRHGRPLTAGELGCYSSHVALWKALVDDETTDAYLVLEDDVIADWNIIERLVRDGAGGSPYLRLYSKKPSRFQLVRRNVIADGFSLIRYLDKTWGTQGYYVGKAAARRFLASALKVRRPIDDQMDRFWEHGVENLALFPHPILEEHRGSSIGVRAKPTDNSRERRAWLWYDRQIRRLHLLRHYRL